MLPRPLTLVCLSIAGRLIYTASPGFRRRVEANMRDLLEDKRPAEIAGFCRAYFQNLAVSLYEILIESDQLESSADWRFELEGENYLQEALGLGRGAILFSPHLGNFFFYYWYFSTRYPCLAVVTAGSRELRPIYQLYHDMGCRGLDYDEASPMELWKTLSGHLRDNGVVLLLGDFWRRSFPKTTFFGRVSRSPNGTAALAFANQVPVIPFYGWRTKGFKHRLVLEPSRLLYERYPKNQRIEATGELNTFLETTIRRVPSQWFYWFNIHERWEEPGVIS
ncbi:MAG: lipid A biosynthesis acyltransferase [Firmicutes bacterium]|nr:lipid A biosynthesis acyltransferase [Bacillota bacterium]